MSVTENEAARQVNSANLCQWPAIPAADEWARAWEAMGEEPAGAFAAAQARGDAYGQYLATLPAEPRLCRCDGCGGAVDLNDDGTVVSRDDEVLCGHCSAAPYMAEEN